MAIFMKRLLFSCLLIGLAGCKETQTGFDKNLLNTSYSKCVDYLTDSLKSPSSLKVRAANISSNTANAEDINSVFGDLITKNGIIEENIKTEKARFRELSVNIDYEAQNSFGASIRGLYQCKYIARLNNTETSPKPLNIFLYKLINDGDDINLGVNIPISDMNGSNFFINSDIKTIVGTAESQFSETDSKRYKEVESINEYKRLDNEAEKLRQSWDESFS